MPEALYCKGGLPWCEEAALLLGFRRNAPGVGNALGVGHIHGINVSVTVASQSFMAPRPASTATPMSPPNTMWPSVMGWSCEVIVPADSAAQKSAGSRRCGGYIDRRRGNGAQQVLRGFPPSESRSVLPYSWVCPFPGGGRAAGFNRSRLAGVERKVTPGNAQLNPIRAENTRIRSRSTLQHQGERPVMGRHGESTAQTGVAPSAGPKRRTSS